MQKQKSQYPISSNISCVILGKSQSNISSVSLPTIKGAEGILFLTFIISVYSLTETAASLEPDCGKQKREEIQTGSPALPCQGVKAGLFPHSSIAISDGERRDIKAEIKERKQRAVSEHQDNPAIPPQLGNLV